MRDECCRKFRGQKPKAESDVETHQSLIFGPFCMVFLWVTFEILEIRFLFVYLRSAFNDINLSNLEGNVCWSSIDYNTRYIINNTET